MNYMDGVAMQSQQAIAPSEYSLIGFLPHTLGVVQAHACAHTTGPNHVNMITEYAVGSASTLARRNAANAPQRAKTVNPNKSAAQYGY